MTPWAGPLYDAVAAGMWLYSRAAFRVTVVGAAQPDLGPGTLLVSTHRRETDVPVLCPSLYGRGRLWRRRGALERVSFAARDDMFLRGFFAGFPPALPVRARRVLFPVGVGPVLAHMPVYPVRSASVARLSEAVRERPETPLAELVRGEVAESFRARAAALALPRPALAGDVLRGEYADLLWRPVSPGDVAGLEGFWSRRAAQAAADFRALVELVRAGGTLLVFPEGRPSPDGEIGPIQRGLAALVRRAEPRAVQPLALAYDPLTGGRTRAFISFGEPVPSPSGDVDAAVLALLRRTTPLTCGQLVAGHLASGDGARTPVRELEGALADAAEGARSQGRNVEPDLLCPERRRRRLAEALAAAPTRAAALSYLAREYRSTSGV